MAESFSIKQGMDAAVVLITGGTGFLGSIILEQLLRCSPGVDTIYVLARGKGKQTAEERITHLLQTSPLFKRLRESEIDWWALCGKVTVVSYELEPQSPVTSCRDSKEKLPALESSKEGNPLSRFFCFCPPPLKAPSETSSSSAASSTIPEAVLSRITHVIHSAARISLEDNIQVSLSTNFLGTKNLLNLCNSMGSLRCFCYISTAFVNINLPWGTSVKEEIYPLMLGDREIEVEDQVQKIMDLSPKAANEKAAALMKLFGFPNTYSMGKSFSERLVSRRSLLLPPGARTIIMRPSFIGALAGYPLPGYTGNLAGPSGAGIAYGLGFYQEGGFAWSNDSLHDALPADVVSGLCIAAISMAGAGHPLPLGMKPDQPWIIHCCSSTINPIFNLEGHRLAYEFFTKSPARWKVISGPYPPPRINYEVDKARVARCTHKVEMRVWMLGWLLRMMGREREAKRLTLGLQQWKEANSTKSNIQLFFSSEAALDIERAVALEEKREFQIIWRGSWSDWSKDYLTYVLEKFMGGGRERKGTESRSS
jgi:fatty acyl-CoA reductase